MPMFRKRPVTVEARPWDSPDAAYGLIEWAGEDVLSYDESISGPPGPVGEDWGYFEVKTLEGEHVASPFDWLIRGVAGEFYFCKPDVFEATYEPADEVR